MLTNPIFANLRIAFVSSSNKHSADNTSNSKTTAPTAKIYFANWRQNGNSNNNSMSIVATTNKQQFVSLSDES